jgi:tetratricopeptide (TPR) repeat protein
MAEGDHAAAVRAAHARHYVVLAQLAEPHLWGHEQAAWLARLEDDYDNLLAALKWASNSGHPETGLVLGAAIFRFWAIRHPREGSEWLAKLLSLGGAVEPQVRARALNAAGNLAQEQGDLQQAAMLHEACVRIWSGPDNPRERSMALNSVGGVLIELGQYAAARANFEESLELRRAEGDPRRVAVALANLAELHRRMGDLARAASLGHESLTLARVAGDDNLIATALNNLGSTSSARGQYDEAAELLGEAAMMFVKLGNQRGVAECCQRLAEVACFAGEGVLAARLLGTSSALRETLGNALVPAERAEYERSVAAARTSIGEQAYGQAWTEGHALPAQRVLADVMQRHRLHY